MARREADLDKMTGDERKAYKKQLDALRIKAFDKMRIEHGRRMGPATSTPILFEAIHRITRRRQGYRSDMEYLLMFLEHRSTPRTTAQPRFQQPFKPMKLPSTTRRAFERAAEHQCDLYTPDGVGNGAERTHGFGRGS